MQPDIMILSRNRRIKSIVVFLALMIVSCKDNPGKAPVPPDKMSAILFDMQAAEAYSAYIDEKTHPSKKNLDTLAVYYAAVFQKHNLDLQQWDEAIDWYLKQPDLWQQVLQSVADSAMKYAPVEGSEKSGDAGLGPDSNLVTDTMLTDSMPVSAPQLRQPSVKEVLPMGADKEELDAIKQEAKAKKEALEKVKNER